MSIPFSVTPAVRTGLFGSGNITFPGGFTKLFWRWSIPNLADFNDVTHHIVTNVLLDGVIWGTSQWDGGTPLRDGSTNPPVQFDISGFAAGQIVAVNGIITGTFLVGIQDGLISSTPA